VQLHLLGFRERLRNGIHRIFWQGLQSEKRQQFVKVFAKCFLSLYQCEHVASLILVNMLEKVGKAFAFSTKSEN
jgi:hypothetical protein